MSVKSDDDAQTRLIDMDGSTEDIERIVATSYQAVRGFWADFRSFISRGPAVDLGVGIILSTFFSSLINSFMNDILTPPIGLVFGSSSLQETFIELRHGKTQNITYSTVAEAVSDGAVTMNIGYFVNQLCTFIIVSLFLYWVIKAYTAIKLELEEQEMELSKSKSRPLPLKQAACPHCDEMVSWKAKRCPYCTSHIQ